MSAKPRQRSSDVGVAEQPGPPDEARRAELEATYQQMLAERAQLLEYVRRRAGLSVDELAKAMGFRGASSIQRYLGTTYDRGFRPELARAFRRALLGKGNPPITDDDLLFLLREKQLEPSDPMWRTHQIVARLTSHGKELLPDMVPGDRLRARLPLAEGEAVIEMPRALTEKSASALRSWIQHLAEMAEDFGKLAGEVKGGLGKTWEK